MILDQTDEHRGTRILLMLVCFVIVVTGLKAAAGVLIPFVLALFLAIASMPVMFALRRRRVWGPLAIALTVLLNALVLGGVVMLATNSLGNLSEKVPQYAVLAQALGRKWFYVLEARGFPASTLLGVDLIEPGRVVAFTRGALQAVASLLSQVFVASLVMIFVLAEATVFPPKFEAIWGRNRQGQFRVTDIVKEVQAYLGLKFIISLVTGVCATALCLLTGLDFVVLLGLIAFALNFIPTIGSILASVPAILLALMLHGEGTALVVALGYFGINTVIGNIVDPYVMGRRLGLSTLVVVLSMVFWGWVWGPVGALLSVPLTVVTKITLQNVPDLSWIAVLLDKVPPQARVGSEGTG
jgi:AI-2 transport protein TqsA